MKHPHIHREESNLPVPRRQQRPHPLLRSVFNQVPPRLDVDQNQHQEKDLLEGRVVQSRG